jgi:predicted nucleotidyltransferase
MDHGPAANLLQRFAAWTQFPPFTWVYRALYAGGIRACVRSLRRLPGVRSVYLWRGLTRPGQAVYGLSDIDILVVVGSAEHVPAVEREYERLRRWVPMLAPRQVNVLHPAQLRMMYEKMPWHRSRIDTERPHWRRLWGRPIEGLLLPSRGDRRDYIWEELKPAWLFFLTELAGPGGRPVWQRRYVAFKTVAETARIAVVVDGADVNISREDALDLAIESYPDIVGVLAEVRSWRRRLAATADLPVEQIMDAVLHLARRALDNRPAGRRHPLRLRLRPPEPHLVRELIGPEGIERLERGRAAVPSIQRAILTPMLYLRPYQRIKVGAGSMHGHWIDMFLLVLIGPRRPGLPELRELNRHLGECYWFAATLVSDGRFAFAVTRTAKIDMATPATRPDAFPDPSATAEFAQGVEITTGWEMEMPLRGRDDVETRARTMLASVLTSAARRLPDSYHLLRLWEGCRSACVAAQKDGPVAVVPTLSAQVVEWLAEVTPEDEAAVRNAHAEYMRAVRGEPSRLGEFRPWAETYARKVARLLSLEPVNGLPGDRP